MGLSRFRTLSEERKSAMRSVIKEWKRRGAPPALLEEALTALSSGKRERAFDLIGSGSEVAGIVCTYGKGSRPKLALSKEDASLLLELVSDLRKCGASEEITSGMIGIACDVVLGGAKPSDFSDPKWKPVFDVLSGFDPKVKQRSLF
jgi:hypothetical protein